MCFRSRRPLPDVAIERFTKRTDPWLQPVEIDHWATVKACLDVTWVLPSLHLVPRKAGAQVSDLARVDVRRV
jgi:hypothetical protein